MTNLMTEGGWTSPASMVWGSVGVGTIDGGTVAQATVGVPASAGQSAWVSLATRPLGLGSDVSG